MEADTNVGGIVGQVATEYDFDPEDDITLTGTESFDVEQTIKAVVRDSRNFGDITGKKITWEVSSARRNTEQLSPVNPMHPLKVTEAVM